MAADPYFAARMVEQAEKVKRRTNDPTWVQKKVEVDLSFFGITEKDVFAFTPYFKGELAPFDVNVVLKVEKPDTVSIIFYREYKHG